MAPVPNNLLTTAEVAERLGVHRSVVIKLVKNGRLSFERKLPTPTGAYLFHPAEIARLEAERAA